MHYILTASHAGNKERLITLQWTVESVIKLNLPEYTHVISISGNNFEYPGVRVYHSPEPLKQFEHLVKIYELLKGDIKDDDTVTMLDDDDLLLAPPPGKLVRGSQWLPRSDAEFPLDLINATSDYPYFERDCEIINDFSGYTVTGAMFKEYFNTRDQKSPPSDSKLISSLLNILLTLEDTKFMNFADEHGAVTPERPFVFHRVWSGAGEWQQVFM